ncbi:MAG: hotdog fold thioesterase [Rhodothermales bacterium]|nr:hotdog fold thioesterase [Rhodothermales bacterium]
MGRSEADRIVESMMEADLFSQWLGIRILMIDAGECELEMVVRDEMVNGFGIAHGGIVYSLADSALAFAANTRGKVSVALNNSISYPAAVFPGDCLRAVCSELTSTRRTGTYDVTITRDAEVVALFRGLVYRKNETHAI